MKKSKSLLSKLILLSLLCLSLGSMCLQAKNYDNEAVFPIITLASTDDCPPAGGCIVTILGTNFDYTIDVKFGRESATFVVNSPTQITAMAPAESGKNDITVTTVEGTSNSIKLQYMKTAL